MVERSLSMREVPGSIPGFSNSNFVSLNETFIPFSHKEKPLAKLQLVSGNINLCCDLIWIPCKNH